MSYCSKCGNKVEENMAFCSRCGAPLKPSDAPSVPLRTQQEEKAEKQEKNEKDEPEKTEKQEKGEYGFVGWLIGGLILITTGLLATLQFAKIIPTGTMIPSLLLIIGSIVIVSALYFVNLARKRAPTP